MTRLVLIRHGESNTHVSGLIGGYRTCNGLSPLGRQQSERLRDRWLATPEFEADVLLTSNFQRAQETAAILAPAVGGLPVEVVDGFGEHDPGEECDGMSFDELTEKFGDLAWVGDPFTMGFPGGETVAAFHYRIGITLADTISRYGDQTVVIACHGGVVESTIRHALHAPTLGVFDLWTVNTSITELIVTSPARWRLVRYNDYAHLAGLPERTTR